ncbi:MAG: hypothetical protein IJA26_02805, partial [Clostridia bacterium]|nr:hypothetical protein [Clostridia bacterium]
LFVAQAERAIDKIGYVSDIIPVSPVQKASVINSANAAYNKLTADEKKQVSNYADLTNATALLESAIALRDEAQDYATELFTRCAKLFNRSEFINLKRVWYSTTGIGHKFTFEFELKNAYGITETVYYGNRLPFLEMTEENLKLASQGLVFTGDSMYFSEGETGAMDDEYGVELNASSIQTYFRKNR